MLSLPSIQCSGSRPLILSTNASSLQLISYIGMNELSNLLVTICAPPTFTPLATLRHVLLYSLDLSRFLVLYRDIVINMRHHVVVKIDLCFLAFNLYIRELPELRN